MPTMHTLDDYSDLIKNYIDMKKLGDFVSATDVTVSSVTYHTYWKVAPTSSNQVYGVAVHPTNGRLYRIYNNKGTYSVTAYDADNNTTTGDGITTKVAKTGTNQSSVSATIAASTTMDNAIGTLLNNDVTNSTSIQNLSTVISKNGAKNFAALNKSPNRPQLATGVSVSNQTEDSVTLTSSGTQSYACLHLYYNMLPAGQYIVSYNAESTDESYAPAISMYYENNTSFALNIRKNEERIITIDDSHKFIDIRLFVTLNDTSVRTVTFSDFMIRLASDKNPTYEPYAKTNQQLTKETIGLIDNQNVNGAKNLFPLTIDRLKKCNTIYTWSGNTYSVGNGAVTFEVNTDDFGLVTSIVVNANNYASAAFLNFANNSNLIHLDAGTYKLNGGVAGGGENLYCWYIKDSVYRWVTDSDLEVVINSDVDMDTSGIVIRPGRTLVNAVFKPMIRLASDTDSTYQPYAKTNQQLTTEVQNLSNQTNAILDNIKYEGVKNLFPFPYYEKTKSGYTVNGNGSIDVNVTTTSSSPSSFNLINNDSSSTWIQDYKGRTLRLAIKSYPTNSDMQMQFTIRDSENNVLINKTVNGSATDASQTFTVPNDAYNATCQLYIARSKTVQVRAYPLICDDVLYQADPNWQEPAKSNIVLTQETTGLIDNTKANGCVNSLGITKAELHSINTVGSWSGETYTESGATFACEYDDAGYLKKVTVNKSSGTESNSSLYLKLKPEFPYLPIKLIGCPSGGGTNWDDRKYYLYYANWNNTTGLVADFGNGGIITSQFNYSTYANARLSLQIKSGQTANNLVFYPMLIPPTMQGISNVNPVSYAKSNKELTEDVSTVDIKSTLTSSYGTFSVTYAYKVGKIVNASGTLTLTSAATAWSKIMAMEISGEKFVDQFAFVAGWDYNNKVVVPLQVGKDSGGKLKIENMGNIANGVVLKFTFTAVLA